MLHVGTNNTGFTPEETTEGIEEIVKAIRLKQPESNIVVVVSISFQITSLG